jgi:Flp pilus assembly pilin Flp
MRAPERFFFLLFLIMNATLNIYLQDSAFACDFWTGSRIMRDFLKAFAKDRSGASPIEYAVVVALISLGMLGGSVTLAEAMGFKFMEFARELYSAF